MKSTIVTLSFIIAAPVLAAQQLLTFEQLAPRLTTQSDTVFVVNFWATWCAPCVAELPYFEQLGLQNKDKKIKILLVSLDNKAYVESKVIPFIKKKKILSEVVVLSEKDPNKWVDKVDSTWTGSIPATLIFDKSKRLFYEQQFASFKELESAFLKL